MMATKPVQEFRFGAVKAAVWENDTDNGTRFNVTFVRLYKDGDDWKTTRSFGRDDLPLLAKAADLAHTWIFTKAQNGIMHTNSNEPEGSRDGDEGRSRRRR
jgi:hypothetical protein